MAALRTAAFVTLPVLTAIVAYLIFLYTASEPVAAVAAPAPPTGPLLMTPEELAAFIGKPKGTPIFLAILGDIFNVTTGRKHYGPRNGYAHFAGRDASAAFATGETEGAGLTDDVSALSDEEKDGVAGWHGFYMNHTNYTYVGSLIGRYYDAQNNSLNAFPWEALRQRTEMVAERKRMLPTCNSKWTQATGSEVWCTTKSGGIERDWVGVPRLYKPSLDPVVLAVGGDPQADRCACASPQDAAKTLPHLVLYAGCELTATRCLVPKST